MRAAAAGNARRPQGKAPANYVWDAAAGAWRNIVDNSLALSKAQLQEANDSVQDPGVIIAGYWASSDEFWQFVLKGILEVDEVLHDHTDGLVHKFNTYSADELHEILVHFAVLFKGYYCAVRKSEGEPISFRVRRGCCGCAEPCEDDSPAVT